MAQDPNTPPVGRQPRMRKLTPSARSVNPWCGTIVGGVASIAAISGGDRFTAEQHATMSRRRLAEDCDAVMVKRQAARDEAWWPDHDLPPVFAFECPVIERAAERVRVIAPSGALRWVQPDGWAHRPFRIARDRDGNPVPPPLPADPLERVEI